ncbi:hypothetical protein RHODO2019_14745 [Rhodococcus antarcticus]|uniref:Uncharacterized protein n=1 Tax=Rhodococcus antarcticus TaxID=2987751 RepID=A0ABY6NZJ0_9NOCA|nr:hypothetical protein [Rhodococcus antarcticus]UZJ24388.1 hypothetical protein RHODO2019_14745 [Rhodococcus antarcticus]
MADAKPAKPSTADLDEEEVEVPSETALAAQKVVAAYAEDADECVVLLDMLGIGRPLKV